MRSEVALRVVWMRGLFQTALAILALVLTAVEGKAKDVRFEANFKESRLTIEGTSTLHDWSAETRQIEGFIEVGSEILNLVSIAQLRELSADPRAAATISIPVLSLKSGKQALDRNMYRALRSDLHQHIKYKLTKVALSRKTKEGVRELVLDTVGVVTVAGVSREIQMEVLLASPTRHQLKLTGEILLKISEFEVNPPTFLRVFTTGDVVKINFAWSADCR